MYEEKSLKATFYLMFSKSGESNLFTTEIIIYYLKASATDLVKHVIIATRIITLDTVDDLNTLLQHVPGILHDIPETKTKRENRSCQS